MKIKGTWAALLMIVALGSGITYYVNNQGQALAQKQAIEMEQIQMRSGRAKDESGFASSSDAAQNPALKRLLDLDAQIAKNQAKDGDASLNARQAAADAQTRLWETEVDRMVSYLEEKLGQEEADRLEEEQKAWQKAREEKALVTSQKASGSRENLVYSQEMTAQTRARAYQLANEYASYFLE